MKLLGIDIAKGYLGCYGAKIIGFRASPIQGISSNGIGSTDKNILLDTPNLYNIACACRGKLPIPLVSNYCFISRQPVITRIWNDKIKEQVKNVDISFKIAPVISIYALMEYLGISSGGISNALDNNPINKTLGLTADLNNVQNPFLLLVSTMLANRQRTPITFYKKGDIYYVWKLLTPNIMEEDLFLTNYIIDYETGDVILNLSSNIAPDLRGQAEPVLYEGIVSGSGSK